MVMYMEHWRKFSECLF